MKRHLTLQARLKLPMARRCITMVSNHHATLPLLDKSLRYFILTSTPHGKQIAIAMTLRGYEHAISPPRYQLENLDIMSIIDTCDVFVLETTTLVLSTLEHGCRSTVNYEQACQQDADISFLWYAASQAKTCILLSTGVVTAWVKDCEIVDAALAVHPPAKDEGDSSKGHMITAIVDVLTGEYGTRLAQLR
ncbi:hypothetical protein HU735_22540 [Pseudomonas sp. BW16M2]|uniref:hypothetical protein n=1 Tax=Pseudomonas sp. BW16M2 TaxID=2745489 RepID=UPI0016468FCB|nr:hypothetical protein [Pseudomonas sp. BW16M2]MBC3438203.1 hypothetical protein [Pseudomonas sp. BW16M2]